MFKRFFVASLLTLCALSASAQDLIDINLADAQLMAQQLPGIGERKARAIVEHRELHGHFESVEDLVAVKGIGGAMLEKLRSRITVSDITDQFKY